MNSKIIVKNLLWDIRSKKRDMAEFERKLQNLRENCSLDDKKYYIIRRDVKVGLFSYVETTLRQIAYALYEGMIPLVDMRGIPNSYVDDEKINDVNMWELFFKQPCMEIADIPEGAQLVYSDDDNMSRIPYRGSGVLLHESKWFWGRMYSEFMRLNEESSRYCDNEYENLIKDKGRVLGVLIRGTDFKFAKGHNIQPQPEYILEKVVELLSKGKYDRVYLATEEYANEKLFRDRLGDDKVIVNKRVYFDQFDFNDGTTINDVSFNREDDKYLRGIEYLSSVMLLSKCDGIIAGLCGGSVAAYYINNGKYDMTQMIDLGILK